MVSKPKYKPAAKPAKQEAEVQEDSSLLPPNWPQNIIFLTEPTYTTSALLSRPLLTHSPSSSPSTWPLIPSSSLSLSPISPNVQILPITHPSTHPAHGQLGLFATQPLLPSQFILLYLGLVHTNSLSDSDSSSDYDLSFDRELDLSIDAARMGNEARCANDFRGVAERPNAEFGDCFVQVPSAKRVGGRKWERRVGVFVVSKNKKGGKGKGGIRAGEEILVSYGKG